MHSCQFRTAKPANGSVLLFCKQFDDAGTSAVTGGSDGRIGCHEHVAHWSIIIPLGTRCFYNTDDCHPRVNCRWFKGIKRSKGTKILCCILTAINAAKAFQVTSPLTAEELASPDVDHLGRLPLVRSSAIAAVMSFVSQLLRAKQQRQASINEATLTRDVNAGDTVSDWALFAHALTNAVGTLFCHPFRP